MSGFDVVRFAVAGTWLLAGTVAVAAHDLAIGPNGGQVVDVDGHHVELTIKERDVMIYFTDGNEHPIATAGSDGQIIVQGSGHSAKAVLTPSAPNVLVGKVDEPLQAGAKVVVTSKLPDGHSILARFVVK